MPNGSFCPFTNTSRSCAPPVFFGSRITTISPAPESARKMSPFGATVSQRGYLKFEANTFTRNPCGTVGRNPSCAHCDVLSDETHIVSPPMMPQSDIRFQLPSTPEG